MFQIFIILLFLLNTTLAKSQELSFERCFSAEEYQGNDYFENKFSTFLKNSTQSTPSGGPCPPEILALPNGTTISLTTVANDFVERTEREEMKRCVFAAQNEAPSPKFRSTGKYGQCPPLNELPHRPLINENYYKEEAGGKSYRNRRRPCLSENYLNTTLKAYEEINQCLGVSSKLLFPLINHESRFQMNIRSSGDAFCLGQLTSLAIRDVHRILHSKYQEVQPYISENFQTADLSKRDHSEYQLNSFDGLFESEQCQSFKAHAGDPFPIIKGKKLNKTTGKWEDAYRVGSCYLIEFPRGLYKCLMYSTIYFRTQKMYFEDLFKDRMTVLSLPQDEKEKKMIIERLALYIYNGSGGLDGARILFTLLEDYWRQSHRDCNNDCPPLSLKKLTDPANPFSQYIFKYYPKNKRHLVNLEEMTNYPRKVVKELKEIESKIGGGIQCGSPYYY